MDDFSRKTSITLIEFDCPKNQPKKLVFELIGDGHGCGEITVHIDQHYSKEAAQKVARAFLHRRLAASFCQMLCLMMSGGLLCVLDTVDEVDSCDDICKLLRLVQPAPTLLSAAC